MKDRRSFEVIESRQMDHLRVFHDVARALTSSLELEEILGAIMDKMAQFFGPERWSMLMVDDKSGELYYAIAVGENTESLKGLRVPLGEGVAGWVASTGNPLVVPDVALDPHWSAFANKHPDLKIKSIACVPVRSGNKTLGVIQLLNSKLDLLSEYSISFLRILCDYAAIAIQNARSMTLIQELTITDDVTGLFNARHLYTMLDEQVALGQVFSLMFVDLDRFKSVNDTHGHLIGSRLLAEIGGLAEAVPGAEQRGVPVWRRRVCGAAAGDGQVGGERNDDGAARGSAVGAFSGGRGAVAHVSGSFGLATYPEDGNTVATILRAADTMMYEAKMTRDSVAVSGKGTVSKSAKMRRRQRSSAGGRWAVS